MFRKLMFATTALAAFSMLGLATPNTAEAGWRYGPGRYYSGYRGGYGARGGYYGGYRGGYYAPYRVARPYYGGYYGGGYYARPYSPGVGLYIGF
ncbi:hypothetical protein Pla175_49470 [Pirellulimonas nuda]|uniref:Uncharacterized protein n=1 Tax=Pirellulimonas nuda TaxID=2528009 RepID=A0A518DJ74_9BACT|nr:hypothetical protein [Pirellulimonas nuda]QDU91518.1 hypothetical protein Pla175_49470 [Pirellulimonas nuda]